MEEQIETRLFRGKMDEAVDWGHERGIPVSVVRDSNGFWMVSARLSDTHGQFRGEAYLSVLEIREALEAAVRQVCADRKKAFSGKIPGHLPVARPAL